MECFAEAPRGRVLLVNADPRDGAQMAIAMQQDGYEVAMASSGYEALEAIKTVHHDMVIIDPALPDMSGAELARCIRTHAPATAPRIIATTGGPLPLRRAPQVARSLARNSTLALHGAA